jgi:hypothetical protein
MNKTKSMLAAAALLLVSVAAQAQTQQAQQTFRCVGSDGKKYYGSTIPQPCLGRPVEHLNTQGLVVKRIDPQASEKEREAKAAEAAKKREQDAAAREVSRRNRALLETYTSEKDIEDARARALADNQRAVEDVEARMADLKKRQADYDKELDFYKGKNKPPAKLNEDIRNAEIDLKAQEDLLAAKRKDVETINNKYNDDKKRYVELTRRGK